MCLTAEALALFLNMIAVPEISMEPGRIVVHAETRDAHWVAVEDEWCTMAPQIDRMDRFASLRAE
ncbi:hypothetical protein [Marivita hallyeonensis]|uniref:Uncharacterized protein n=1 Tax=Marivita hallyeonensis TaxID=996342 RepID=A0A1M5NQ84_9RHOB|nr:hypothetical protein [Marivita hallyeonensis]SHG91627.1 hypothetical protein SAMN05443551_1007 [Marivita hallyeonensis]